MSKGKNQTIVTDVYRTMNNAPEVGQIRRMQWATILPPSGPEDELWIERCKNYWENQRDVYGVQMSDFTFWYDLATETVVTESVILRILPGKRVLV